MMKICPNCHAQLQDTVAFCPACGTNVSDVVPVQNPVYTQQPKKNAYDHTAEFDASDIAENKLYAALIYLASIFGIIIALLAAPDSAYVKFHLKQCIKLYIALMILAVASAVLVFTFIVPILCAIAIVVVLVLWVIALVQVFMGKAKEPAIIREISFLK